MKERLTFTGDDTPMATLLLSVRDAFAAVERALIRERQAEGIALAKQRGVYQGGRPRALTRSCRTHRLGQFLHWTSRQGGHCS